MHKENVMQLHILRRLMTLLAAAALFLYPLCAASAGVTDIVPFPADRLIIGDAPRGMVRQVLQEDGLLRVIIDTEATNWPEAVAAMQFPCGTDPATGETLTYLHRLH